MGVCHWRKLVLGCNQKRSQLSNLKLQKTDNSDVVTNISYDYYNGSGGNNGRVRYITDHLDGNYSLLDGNYSLDVGYDDHNRLTSYGSHRSYTYDAWNNLTLFAVGSEQTSEFAFNLRPVVEAVRGCLRRWGRRI